MAGSDEVIEQGVRELLQRELPKFDPTKVEFIDSPTQKDFQGVETVSLVGTIHDMCVLAYKAGKNVIKVVAMPVTAYDLIAFLLALSMGIQLPSLPKVVADVREQAIEGVVSLCTADQKKPYTVVHSISLPNDLQFSQATGPMSFDALDQNSSIDLADYSMPINVPPTQPGHIRTIQVAVSGSTNTSTTTTMTPWTTGGSS